VAARSPLAGTTVGESGIHRDYGIIVLALKHSDGSTVFNPKAREQIRSGDYLIAMGEPASMSNLELVAGNPQ